MKLYHLVSKRPFEYDTNDAFIVRASSEAAARRLAASCAADEGSKTWLDPKFSSCEILISRGEADVILASFNAG